jgi:hypothetical protein
MATLYADDKMIPASQIVYFIKKDLLHMMYKKKPPAVKRVN